MTEAYRCDITDQCIPADGNRNPYWTLIRNDNVTVLGKQGVQIKIKVEVDVFQNGTPCHISDTAKTEINRLIRLYVQSLT